MVCISLLLTVIVTGMNIINYNSVIREADNILIMLSYNSGRFPDFNDNSRPGNMSPEIPYESRFFSVLLNDRNETVHTDTVSITAVNSESAIEYARQVIEKEESNGFIGNYRYMTYTEGTHTRITFLDCGRKMATFRIFLYASIGMSLFGLIFVFFAIQVFSKMIIRPVAESYEKQKRFITDAGHEIKTPLTIINANIDILDEEYGEDECISDIRQQTNRLTSLTNNLIYLARMEETDKSLDLIDIPLSDAVRETVLEFKPVADSQGKEIILNLQPTITIKGNPSAIRQLISILMDNALKYSPCGENITVFLSKQGKNVRLTFCNKTSSPISRNELHLIFERFYRTDRSRNSSTGGHGIGLSIAQAIVTAHGGTIQAWSNDDISFNVSVTFPS